MIRLAVDFTAIFRAQDKVSSQLNNINKSGSNLSGTFKKLAATAAGVFTAAKVIDFSKQSVNAFTNFENGMNEVFTLLPGISGEAMGTMTTQVKKFSKDFSVLPEKTVPALYQALSAGVPQNNVFAFLETANKAAVGGVTTLETAVDGLTSVVNSYGADVISVNRASDLMFTTVKLGKTNFEELSGSLFNVLPSASAANLAFEDVSASLAALTAQGVPTSVATTRVRSVIDELSKAGTKTDKVFRKVAGKGFKDFIAQGGNLQGALQLLEKEAIKNNLGINDLFGSIEAGGAALGLTGKGTETFTNALNEMAKSSGATDTAFAKMEQGFKRKLDKMKANIEVLKLSVGGKLVGAFNYLWDKTAPIIDDISVGFENLKDLFKNFGFSGSIEKIFGADIGAIAKLAESYALTYIGGLKKIFSGDIEAGTIDIMKAIGFDDSSISAVMKTVNGIWENLKKVPGIVAPAFSVVKESFSSVIPTAKEVMNYFVQKVAPIFQDVFGYITDTVLPKFISFWETNIPKISSIFSNTWNLIKPLFDAFISTFKNVLSNIKPIVGGVIDTVLGLGSVIFTTLDYMTKNFDKVKPVIIGFGIAFAIWNLDNIFSSVINLGSSVVGLGTTIAKTTLAIWGSVTAKIADKAETLSIMALYAGEFLKSLWTSITAIGAQTAAYITNGIQIAAQSAGLFALKAAQIISQGATMALAAAQWALNAAFIASPIGWVVLAIGALIAIGVLLYKNWDAIKLKAFELWEGIQAAFMPIGAFFAGIWENVQISFNNFMGYLSSNFPMIADLISVPINTVKNIFEGLKLTFSGVVDFVKGVFTGNWQQAWDGVKSIFGGVFNSLAALAKHPINAVIAIVNGAIRGINNLKIDIPDWVPMLGGKKFGINIPEMPMLAKGSKNAPDLFVAGEQGPEIVAGRGGSRVFPSDDTTRIISALEKNNQPLSVSTSPFENINMDKNDEPISNEKNININFNGSGTIKASGIDKNQVLEIILEYIKPIIIDILSTEVFEEGVLSYDF